jgi:hypothetical protein
MTSIEEFKEDLKAKQSIAIKNELTEFGVGYLTAIERYESLILHIDSEQRKQLYAVCDELSFVIKQPLAPSLKSLIVNKILNQ